MQASKSVRRRRRCYCSCATPHGSGRQGRPCRGSSRGRLRRGAGAVEPVPFDVAPPPVFAPTQWQQSLTLWTHRGLYLLLIVLPFSGYLMSLAAGRPVVLFNQIALPVLLGENKPLAEQLKELHEILATLLFLLVALHSAAALWHQFFLRDSLLSRMWPGGDDQA